MQNSEALGKLKKDELTALCKQNGVSGYSKMKKDEMIAALLAVEGVKPAEAAEPAKKPAAKKSCAKKAPAEAAAEKPAKAEKKAPAEKAVKAVKSADKGDALADYCTALVNLWGVAPITHIVSVYNLHHAAFVTADDVRAAAEGSGSCVVDGDELIHKSLANDKAELDALRGKKSAYPLYLPTADEIKTYLNPAFRESSHAFRAMSGFLCRSFRLAEDKAGEVTGKIVGFLNSENDLDTLISQLKELGVKFEDNIQFRNFGVLVNNLKNSARLWELNGHTAAEARNFADSKGPVRVIKVGRNDPCPCGSGKKYKKCCGR